MDGRVNELLPLAAKIAREFANIPGLPHAEIEMAAQEALVRAASRFDPAKGDFTAYAATAIRNTLRDLYECQLRHHRHHVYDLDLLATQTSTSPEARINRVPAGDAPGVDQAAAMSESRQRLDQAMLALSPRLRLVAEGIRDGKSYSEIGADLGVSKQAAHKLAGAAIATLREHLAAMGFSGLDTLGLLKSRSRRGIGDPCVHRLGEGISLRLPQDGAPKSTAIANPPRASSAPLGSSSG
ncbi:MAG: sigma-70 family RNA polymerase sigma factor [Akkermansiaceae bacterium]|nr:sigma-70 family RNA polymerase sigma factor [Akkermansiaceae bacterium]